MNSEALIRNVSKFSKLLEYGIMAQASEDPKHLLSSAEGTKKKSNKAPIISKRKKPSESFIL